MAAILQQNVITDLTPLACFHISVMLYRIQRHKFAAFFLYTSVRQRRRMFLHHFIILPSKVVYWKMRTVPSHFHLLGLFPTRELLNRCWGGNLIRGHKPMRERCLRVCVVL